MSSSSKDRGSNGRDDCQIHVDKEGESCVIKIESVGQEKMLKELIGRFNSLKSEVNQLLSGQQKPREMMDAIQDMTAKLKPLEDQLQRVNKNVGDDHAQLNKLNTDVNKKLDDIKQDLNNFKEQQKNFGSSKDIMDRILQKLDNLDKNLRNSQDEGQKRVATDLQNLKQQIPTKNDFKPVLDAIQNLQTSFDKEKTKPDILARKLDSIDQKIKETQPEHLALIKDIQTKIEPLHKTTPQQSETLMKINDRVKAMHAETTKPHPDIIQKLDNIDYQLKHQPNSLVEPIKQVLDEKLNPFFEQTKKDGEQKLGTLNTNEKDSHSPSRVPLCVNGMIPVSSSLSDPHVLQALAGDIAKKLADIQSKMASSDDQKRKQDDLVGNLARQQAPLIDEMKRLTPLIDKLKQQQQKDGENLNKELEKSIQPINEKLTDLTNQQQPLLEAIKDLPKTLDDIRQSQPQTTDLIKELSSKLDPLTQSIKAIQDNLDQQKDNNQNADKTSETMNQQIDKALQPFSQMIKDLKDNIEQSQADAKKFDHLEEHLSKSFDTIPNTSDIINKLDEISQTLKQTDPTINKLSDDINTIKNLVEKQTSPDDLLSKINDIHQKQKAPLEEALKDIHSKVEPIHQASKHSVDMKKTNDDINNKLDKLIDPLNKVNEQIQNLSNKLDEIQPISNEDSPKRTIPQLLDAVKNLEDQISDLKKNWPDMSDLPKQIGSLKDTLERFDENDSTKEPARAIKDINEQLKILDETLKGLPDQISSKVQHLGYDDDRTNPADLRQVPFSQSIAPKDSNNPMSTSDGQIANLFTNLLTLQTAMQNAEHLPSQDIQQYLQRIEQSPLVQNDQDLQGLVENLKTISMNKNNSMKSNGNLQNSTTRKDLKPSKSNIKTSDFDQNSTNRLNPIRNNVDQSSDQQYSSSNDDDENRKTGNKMVLPSGYLTKSRYISFLSNQTIRDNWPKLSSKSSPIIESILNQPLEFDKGTNLDRLIKQNGLEQYASLTKNAIEKTDKDYDKISYMMDSIVFDKMTMIGSREALIRPWDPSLLNRASSKGLYPFPSEDGRRDERFRVEKDIALWMVETDDDKPYTPTEFAPNISRLNDKYDRIQQPQFHEIRQKRREDETRWNERYAFTKDQRMILFVNDLRSYFMDYDTKRKYQVHDDVPINPVCRTGIAGRGDLPFWGPNHCVVVVLLRNINDPDVVLMKHHGDALVLPKGFYGREARYDNQIKIVQDPVSGQILPPKLFDYWWSNVFRLNEMNSSTNNLRRVLNEKQLKDEFAEIFSQKGCNKSVFDNGYVDHPLNTDHAWVESSVWKVQFKEWRIPEMRAAKYSIAEDLKTNHAFPFVWMKLTDALLVVPPFDRGILVDVLATGMPL